jgi:hypothetical protein
MQVVCEPASTRRIHLTLHSERARFICSTFHNCSVRDRFQESWPPETRRLYRFYHHCTDDLHITPSKYAHDNLPPGCGMYGQL